ncbi:MAG: heavy-metal-associated domain-containing protein [Coleofasciculaceae cyanobacterium RL_1_1]|jgi:copper chaperone|nr:heavy-metal-associated domain-containing protein [Coleofasciculaceae cyanobacterium RL_1_1]
MYLEFVVPDMACSACVKSITRAIQSFDGSAEVNANTDTKQVTVSTSRARIEIEQTIMAAGYTVVSPPSP